MGQLQDTHSSSIALLGLVSMCGDIQVWHALRIYDSFCQYVFNQATQALLSCLLLLQGS